MINESFTWRPAFSLDEIRRQAAVLWPFSQAFLYAQSHVAVRVLKSASGHRMRRAEKENSDGRHIDTTFSAWSILRSSFLRRQEATLIVPSNTFLRWTEESSHILY